MQKLELRGYVKINDKNYTFFYKDGLLNLISIEPNPSLFGERTYIEYIEGYTIEEKSVSFYINDFVDFYSDSCICFAKIVILSRYLGEYCLESGFDSIYMSGGILNRFYSNKKAIEIKQMNDLANITIKRGKMTTSREDVIINGNEVNIELSIPGIGYRDDGTITFNPVNSNLRINYQEDKDYKTLIQDILAVNRLFYFCANRKNINYEKIYLQKNGNSDDFQLEIIIPRKENKEEIKNMIQYDFIKGKLTALLKILEELEYINYTIPKNNIEFTYVEPKDYVSKISAYQAVYEYVIQQDENSTDSVTTDDLEEVKNEIIQKLKTIDEKYKGKIGCRIKRKFIKRFTKIVQSSNLKLEKQIENVLNDNQYVLDTLGYELKKKIENISIEELAIDGIKTRDDITHDDIVKLKKEDIAVYLLVNRLIYVLIFNYIGIDANQTRKIIEYLAIRNII